MKSIQVSGIVSEIVYENELNGYTVCDIDVDGVLITAVGIMPGVSPGESLCLEGTWISHPEYGEQLKVTSYEKLAPTSKGQILLYLSSGIIKGIGAATAKKIVDKFGEDSLNIIRDEPEKLSKIKGISIGRAMEMQSSFIEKQALQNLAMFLQPFGVTVGFALKVYKRFGSGAVAEIERNPYILCEVEGIGFKTADKIAFKMGIDPSSIDRLKNGLNYIMSEYAQGGHTYILYSDLIRFSEGLLGCNAESAENAFKAMLIEGKIIKEPLEDDEAVYLPAFYNAETSVARGLYHILGEKQISISGNIETVILSAEKQCGIVLSEEQKNACRLVMENGAVVITGGPGTGKTTVINSLLEILVSAGLEVALCAPTGRAAKRLGETCGMEARTIHRLLEYSYGGDKSFERNSENPLLEDVIIVDEMSMVDILLMNALLKAIKTGARLIMVGDADQLPSVGAGNVLRDIIESGKIPTCRLTEIYRQAAESMIVVNAHKINKGEMPVVNVKDKDFFFMRKENGDDILNVLTEVCCDRLPKAYGFDPIRGIQVITPSRKTRLGVYELNRKIQDRLNPPDKKKKEKAAGEFIFREGDKVMQVKNNYDILWQSIKGTEDGQGVFNGDIGIIHSINPEAQYLDVLFDGEKIARYDFLQLDEIEPAYAITVHKSQGSEFDAVVMPMFPTAPQLMNRNLLYTALTRAKKLVVMVGRDEVLFKMITNNRESMRFSGLKRRIEGIINV